eukprot:159009-Rhodomonas_salina.3
MSGTDLACAATRFLTEYDGRLLFSQVSDPTCATLSCYARATACPVLRPGTLQGARPMSKTPLDLEEAQVRNSAGRQATLSACARALLSPKSKRKA